MNTYAELTAAVAAFIGQQGNSEVESQIPVFVSLGEDDIYRVLRHDRMLKTQSVGILPFTLPTDFLEAKAFWCGDTLVRYVSPDVIISGPNTAPTTSQWSILGTELIFDAPPEGCGELIYYARPAPLAAEVNVLFTQNSDVFLFAALAHAMIFLRDEARQQSWVSAYQAKMGALTDSAIDERVPLGHTLSITYR